MRATREGMLGSEELRRLPRIRPDSWRALPILYAFVRSQARVPKRAWFATFVEGHERSGRGSRQTADHR